MFPDQYGRIQCLQVDAQHFLTQQDFVFRHNPFQFDIAGKKVEFKTTKLEDEITLRPDMTTLRTCSWRKNEAYVICDILNALYSPRQILKDSLINTNVVSAQIKELTF